MRKGMEFLDGFEDWLLGRDEEWVARLNVYELTFVMNRVANMSRYIDDRMDILRRYQAIRL